MEFVEKGWLRILYAAVPVKNGFTRDVHSGVMGSLEKIGNFMCKNCTAGGVKVADEVKQFVLENNDKMEVVEKFCYVGDVMM